MPKLQANPLFLITTTTLEAVEERDRSAGEALPTAVLGLSQPTEGWDLVEKPPLLRRNVNSSLLHSPLRNKLPVLPAGSSDAGASLRRDGGTPASAPNR